MAVCLPRMQESLDFYPRVQCMLEIIAYGKWRQEDAKFKDIPGHISPLGYLRHASTTTKLFDCKIEGLLKKV